MGAAIQFFRGVDEPVIPDIKLTRSRDGMTGQAKFVFEELKPWPLKPWATSPACSWSMKRGTHQPRSTRFVNRRAFAEATYTQERG